MTETPASFPEAELEGETLTYLITPPHRFGIQEFDPPDLEHLQNLFSSQIAPEDGNLMDFFEGHLLHKITFQFALCKATLNGLLPMNLHLVSSGWVNRAVLVYQGLGWSEKQTVWQLGRTPESTLEQYETALNTVMTLANQQLKELGITKLFEVSTS